MDTITRERLSFLIKCLDSSIVRTASANDAMLAENIKLVRDEIEDIVKE